TLETRDDLAPRAQAHDRAARARRLRKEDGHLDWTGPAGDVAARVRGVNPWPGAVTTTPVGRLLVWRARAVPGDGPPGVLVETARTLAVGTGAGLLVPLEVQPENRRAMPREAFLRGARAGPGPEL